MFFSKKGFVIALLLCIGVSAYLYLKPKNKDIQNLKSFTTNKLNQVSNLPIISNAKDTQRRLASKKVLTFQKPLNQKIENYKQRVIQEKNGVRYLADEILIGFTANTPKSEILHWSTQYHLTLLDYQPKTGLVRFKINEKNLSVKYLLEILSHDNHPNIRYTEPNHVFKLSYELPNDYDSALWYIKNDGKTLSATANDEDNNAININIDKKLNADIAGGKIESAWDLQSGGPVIVAVPDTGVDIFHPDFTELTLDGNKIEIQNTNIWQNESEIADNGLDDDNNGFIDDVFGWDFMNNDNDPSPDVDFETWIEENVIDEDEKTTLLEKLPNQKDTLLKEASHGTHIAGVIAALSNNNKGITAIAQQGVKVMPLKMGTLRVIEVDDEETGEITQELAYALASTSQVAQIISYAQSNGAHILNASWGTSGNSQTLKEAIKNASEILFIAAAGNDGQDNDDSPYFPSSFQFNHLISVAASDTEDEKASFSNIGETSVHIAAPGRFIRSLKASLRKVEAPETFQQAETVDMSGTSMAAGILSGASALVYLELQTQKESFDAGEIKYALMQTVRPSLSFSGKIKSGGIVDLFNALDAIRNDKLETYTPEVFDENQSTASASSDESLEIQSVGGCGSIQSPHNMPFEKGIDFFIPFLFMLFVLIRFRHRKKVF